MIIQVMNNILMMSLRFDFFIDVKTKKRGGRLTHIFFFFGVVKRILIMQPVGRNKPVRATARTGVSGISQAVAEISGNATKRTSVKQRWSVAG
jgi:hypothetical protein